MVADVMQVMILSCPFSTFTVLIVESFYTTPRQIPGCRTDIS